MHTYKRKGERVAWTVPTAIKIRDDENVEQTHQGEVIDASKYGLKIKVDRFYRRQTVLLLTLCFPLKFRAYSFASEYYRTYATVVYSKKYGPEDFEIGVRLLHDQIPLDFEPFGA